MSSDSESGNSHFFNVGNTSDEEGGRAMSEFNVPSPNMCSSVSSQEPRQRECKGMRQRSKMTSSTEKDNTAKENEHRVRWSG